MTHRYPDLSSTAGGTHRLRGNPPPRGRTPRRFVVVRVNRDPSDTHAVTNDEHNQDAAIERAIELANPDDGAYLEYAIVMAPDAGAARITRPGRWYPLPAYQPNPLPRASDTDPVHAILAGMARAIFVTSWANWVDESPSRRDLAPGPGGDWDDAAPATPRSAETAARKLWRMYEALNGPMFQLLQQAAFADGARRAARGRPGHIGGSDLITAEYADSFGHYLAMMAMGHGVSWFDDHERFELQTPNFEAWSFNGRSVEWSPR